MDITNIYWFDPDLYGMKNAKQNTTTDSKTIIKNVSDTTLSPEEYSAYRTATGKLLWLALIRDDIAYATKELSRDLTAPIMQISAKVSALVAVSDWYQNVRFHQLSDGNCSLDGTTYMNSDWAGCSKTRKLTSGSTMNIFG